MVTRYFWGDAHYYYFQLKKGAGNVAIKGKIIQGAMIMNAKAAGVRCSSCCLKATSHKNL